MVRKLFAESPGTRQRLAGAIDEARAVGDLVTPDSGAELAAFIVSADEGAAVRAKAAGSIEPMRNFERMAAHLLP